MKTLIPVRIDFAEANIPISIPIKFAAARAFALPDIVSVNGSHENSDSEATDGHSTAVKRVITLIRQALQKQGVS